MCDALIERLEQEIKWLYRINFFLFILILGVGVIEVPNFRDMVDKQIYHMEDYNGAVLRMEQIESRYADIDSVTYMNKRLNLLSDLMQLKETGRLEAHNQ